MFIVYNSFLRNKALLKNMFSLYLKIQMAQTEFIFIFQNICLHRKIVTFIIINKYKIRINFTLNATAIMIS